MEANGVSPDDLLERPWLPVSIDGCHLLAKSWFGETRCRILLTDLHCVWEETMHTAAIQSRAQELNKRLQAPVEAFFAHLCEVVQPYLSGSGRPHEGEAHISLMRLDGGNMVLRLKSKLAGLPFFWEFRCTPAPITVVCLHLVRPLLSMSHVLHQQVELLEGLLARKDAEIQDYKDNGATLSRARLQTDIFDQHTYRSSFLAKVVRQTLKQEKKTATGNRQVKWRNQKPTQPQHSRLSSPAAVLSERLPKQRRRKWWACSDDCQQYETQTVILKEDILISFRWILIILYYFIFF
ncbi:non-homologous end-joining factor 1 isoform X2 [Dunckerocampus dactyliophorus]|uniref:non-homologous end-joining factor 1 isoform X2 n=1 Tax=Dunckerocampus dactyliophorus TaxID=161453 RepID=UPI002405AD27|nr:non-homologous end-joining factor 1 isoform X2 [Dunckerocampus dactyliophorus]